MATSLRTAPRGRLAPKTWPTDPEEHRRLLAEGIEGLFGRVGQLERLIVLLVPSAVGSLDLIATAAFPNLDSTTWVPITQYDSTVPSNASEAKGVTLDVVNGTIAPGSAGIWRVDFSFSMEHDESNQGRTLELRFFNVDTATPSEVVSIAIGRNQPGTSYSVAIFAELAVADIDDAYRLELKMEVGSGGLNLITFTELSYALSYVDAVESLDFGT